VSSQLSDNSILINKNKQSLVELSHLSDLRSVGSSIDKSEISRNRFCSSHYYPVLETGYVELLVALGELEPLFISSLLVDKELVS